MGQNHLAANAQKSGVSTLLTPLYIGSRWAGSNCRPAVYEMIPICRALSGRIGDCCCSLRFCQHFDCLYQPKMVGLALSLAFFSALFSLVGSILTNSRFQEGCFLSAAIAGV